MTIDLTKAKPGWIAHFRCGGSAEITKMYGGQTLLFGDGGYTHTVAYTQYGEANTPYKSPFDIIKLEQPSFDWATVKPGMAFIRNDWGGIYEYIGVARAFSSGGGFVFVFRSPDKKGEFTSSYANPEMRFTRAPEHDIEVPE